MGQPRTEEAIVDRLHEIQRQEEALRDEKRALDRELVSRRRIDAEHRDDTDVVIVRLGEG